MKDATGRTSPSYSRAAQIARGVSRFFAERGNGCLSEFSFKTGRRADIIAIDDKGTISVIEIKSSVPDFRSDKKWQEYLEFCDRFYFAVGADFPIDILPSECGLVIADAYGASIIREPEPHRLIAARRKSITLRFARLSANRLMQFTDPDWIRG